MGGQQKSRRLRMPRHNRLLSKPHMKKRMLRKPREFYLPFLMGMMNQAQQNPQGTAQSAVSSKLAPAPRGAVLVAVVPWRHAPLGRAAAPVAVALGRPGRA